MTQHSDKNAPSSLIPEETQPSDGPLRSAGSPSHHLPTNISDGIEIPDPLLQQQLGNLQITALLGEGGFGKVYKAFDTVLQRHVAIKYLKETLESKSNVLFKREAKALAALSQHPNIVTIYHWGEHDGHPYFVLEFIDQAADKLLADFPEGLPVATALKLVAQCADALQAAHDQNILHRDVKPANILLEGKTNHVKLADFGLARLGEPSESFTISNTLSGSPPYMSPEQAKGEPLDHRTDVFSLGVSLYQLLSGCRPYEGNTSAQIVDNVRNDVRVPLRSRRTDLPDAIYDIVERSTAVRLSERIQSAGEFAEVLRQALADFELKMARERDAVSGPTELTPSLTGGAEMMGEAGPPVEVAVTSRRPVLIVGGLVLVLVALGGMAILLPTLFSDHKKPSRSDSASAQAIIAYFCDAWSQENYEGMYNALFQVKQDEVSFAEWKGLVQKESERVGIPKSYTIEGPLEEHDDRSMWKVDIAYMNERVGTLTKTTWVIRGEDGWRIGRGGLSGILQNHFGPDTNTQENRGNAFGPG